jgi:hypothetical protein
MLVEVSTTISNPRLLEHFHKNYGGFKIWPEMRHVYEVFYIREMKLLSETTDPTDMIQLLNKYKEVVETTFNGMKWETETELATYTKLPAHVAIQLVNHAAEAAIKDYTYLKSEDKTIH